MQKVYIGIKLDGIFEQKELTDEYAWVNPLYSIPKPWIIFLDLFPQSNPSHNLQGAQYTISIHDHIFIHLITILRRDCFFFLYSSLRDFSYITIWYSMVVFLKWVLHGVVLCFFALSCLCFISNDAEMIMEVECAEGKGPFLSGYYTF